MLDGKKKRCLLCKKYGHTDCQKIEFDDCEITILTEKMLKKAVAHIKGPTAQTKSRFEKACKEFIKAEDDQIQGARNKLSAHEGKLYTMPAGA